MEPNLDLGPLRLSREPKTLRFELAAPNEMSLDLPPNYDSELAAKLTEILTSAGQCEILMDMANLPAISSRQLGVLLALHKAVRPRVKRLPIANTSAGVRHLLAVTRTAQFFDLI